MIRMLPNTKVIGMVVTLLMPVTVAQVVTACNQASYHVRSPGSDSEAPQNLGNSEGQPAAPTARVEVIFNNGSVTTVPTGSATTVQPSNDTLSPSFVGPSNCANPGIIRADYTIKTPEGEVPLSAVRAPGSCDSLSVPYTFKNVGDYPITMIVTDENNLTAIASMTMTIIDGTKKDGGFTIAAVPMLTQATKPIAFTGYCYMPAGFSISWDFGDGATASGISGTHAYNDVGQYLVKAACTSADGKTVKTASVSVVIISSDIGMPSPTYGVPMGPPAAGPSQSPFQSPGQRPAIFP